MAVHQGRLDEGAHAALRRLGRGQKLADKSVGLKGADVPVCDGADAEHGDVLLLHQRVKGDVGGDGQLPAHIVAVNVSGGVRLGIAQLLGLLQNFRERHRGGVHGVHNEVGGAVHNAAQLADAVQPLAPFQVGQPRNAPAYGGGAAQGNAAFPGQTRQLRVVGADDRLVDRHHMLARLQRGADVLVSRVQPAHDLCHDADSLVVYNVGDVRHRQRPQVRPRPPHQNLGHSQILPTCTKIQNAAAHNAAAQKSNVHNKTSPVG